MKLKKIAAALSGGALLVVGANAQALIITETGSFGTQGTTSNVPIGVLNETISIAGFNTALGTLDSVAITVFGQLDSEGSSTNTSTPAGAGPNGRAEVALQLQTDWMVSTSAANDYTFANNSFSYLSDESSVAGYTLGVNDVFNFDMTSTELSSVLTGVNLASFTTGNLVDFTFSTIAATVINNSVDSGTGAFTNSFATGSWGKVNVVYNYSTPNPVPAPASLLLLGLGLAGIAGFRRKKTV